LEHETEGKWGHALKNLRAPLNLFISFWAIAIVLWQIRGNIFYLFNFGYVGTFKMDIGGNEHIQRRNRLTRP